MARPSAAALSIHRPPPPDGHEPAPEDLSEVERALWVEIVESKPADWFGADSRPILKEYVRATVACDRLAEKVNKALEGSDVRETKVLLDLRDREARRVASLATKLRLTQQSRYGARSAARADARAPGKRPWQS